MLAVGFLSLPNAPAQTAETFNTAGTTPWICPAGVTSVQVECWGGGGAGGGAENTSTASTGTINVAGGGGAGGAYARTLSVPVTPGNSYDITIPAAATNPAPSPNGTRVNGGTVSFAGDAGVSVTAVGGQGGASRVASSTGTGAGGVGSTTGCVGGVVFPGGSCNVPNNGTTGGGGGTGPTRTVQGLRTSESHPTLIWHPGKNPIIHPVHLSLRVDRFFVSAPLAPVMEL